MFSSHPMDLIDFNKDKSGTTTISTGIQREDDEVLTIDAECQHEYVDVGFNFSLFVCKKCNKESKEWV